VTVPGAGRAGLDAIVLAGGGATRLGGADKPGLVVAGSTLVGSVAAAAVAAGARGVVVVGAARPEVALIARERQVTVSFVAEDPPGSGPVPALRRGLAEVTAPVVALLAADLPFLRAAQLRLLHGAIGPAAAGAVLVDDCGRAQWLAGCWRATALREAAASYQGASMRGLLGPLQPLLVSYELGAGEPPPWFDCDTAADLAAARRWPAGRWAADGGRS
jgi:molybdopterin-guanine dinucleotide biosynthesis protein A